MSKHNLLKYLMLIVVFGFSPGIYSYEIFAQTGAIQGTVTEDGSATADPIKNLQVEVYDFSVQGSPLAFGFTDDSGGYTISGLAARDYKVYFNPWDLNYIPEWFDNADTFDLAAKVTVTAGNTTTSIDAQLLKGGVIQGTVTDEVTNLGIEGLPIFVFEISTQHWIASSGTDPTGKYTVSGLSAGNYIVEFGWQNSLNYIIKYFDNQVDFNKGTPVLVSTGKATKGIDAQLAKGGIIQGTVAENRTNIPLQDIEVRVYDAINQDSLVSSMLTDALGKYSIERLSTGNYKIYFSPFAPQYIPEWYNNAYSFGDAALVSVTTGDLTVLEPCSLEIKYFIYLPIAIKP